MPDMYLKNRKLKRTVLADGASNDPALARVSLRVPPVPLVTRPGAPPRDSFHRAGLRLTVRPQIYLVDRDTLRELELSSDHDDLVVNVLDPNPEPPRAA